MPSFISQPEFAKRVALSRARIPQPSASRIVGRPLCRIAFVGTKELKQQRPSQETWLLLRPTPAHRNLWTSPDPTLFYFRVRSGGV